MSDEECCETCGRKLQGVAGIDLPCADPRCSGIPGDYYVVMSPPKDGISQKITLGRIVAGDAIRWHEERRQAVNMDEVDAEMRRDVMRRLTNG